MCKGKEWLMHDVYPGHPLFGKIVRCDVCGMGAQQAFLRSRCGLPVEMQGWEFEGTRRTMANAAAYDVARLLAESPRHFITLLGGFGVGKTRLLACIVNAGRAAGWLSVYTTTATMLDYLRGAYDKKIDVTYDARWELLRTAKILAIDEFDRFSPTDWAREKFEQLIGQRYDDKANVLTAFAANARMDDLPGYVASRMQDHSNYIFELAGADVRKV